MKGFKTRLDREGLRRQFYYGFKYAFYPLKNPQKFCYWVQTGRAALFLRRPTSIAASVMLSALLIKYARRYNHKSTLEKEWNEELEIYKRKLKEMGK